MIPPTSSSRAHTYVTDSDAQRGTSSAARPATVAANDARQRSSPASGDSAQFDDALAVARQQLTAALQEIDALRRRDLRMRQQLVAAAEATANARRFAYHDELTGLPNRRLLIDHVNQAVAQCKRQHKHAALLFLDLDGFKRINDGLGHAAGDSLLRQVAARLVACIRLSDTACRYGGDEFVVLLPQIDSEREAATVAAKISDHLAGPYVVGGREIRLTTSIGISVYPIDGQVYSDLIAVSDREMYLRKNALSRS